MQQLMKIKHFLLVMVTLLLASCEEKEVVVDMRIKGIALSEENLAIAIGQSATLIATLDTQDAVDLSIKWGSSNTDIATVNNGTVTGLAYGQVIITATASNGKKAWCNVTVNYPPPTSITLNRTTLSLLAGAQEVLIASMLPAVAEQTASWSSNNTAVAAVSDDGTVTAVDAGTAIITATTSNNLTATCTVTVETLPATGIQMETLTLEVSMGYTAQAIVRILPFPGAAQTVRWSSSNQAIATVDAAGVVSGVALGEVTLTATAVENNSYQATCAVTVVPVRILTLEDYTGSKATFNYTDDSKLELQLENGQAIFISVNKTIRSITMESGGTILMGRKANSGNITLKIKGARAALRDAVDGVVPIGSYAEFQLISTALAGSYKLEADLDFMSETWTGIGDPGSEAVKFTGAFDGDHHSISNLKVNATGNTWGLFRYLSGDAVVKNIGIESGTVITSGVIIGGIAGKMEGTASITGCYNKASVTSSANQAGGIVGWSIAGTDCKIIACYNAGTINGGAYVGGIVGYATGTLNITACYNTGNVTGTGSSAIAGIVHDATSITACYNTGTITNSTGAGLSIGANSKVATCYALINTGSTNVKIFGGAAWPSTSVHAEWGTGDGSSNGKYWKDLGSWNGGSPTYPTLFFE
jgi:uncharacterized protein YjdB